MASARSAAASVLASTWAPAAATVRASSLVNALPPPSWTTTNCVVDSGMMVVSKRAPLGSIGWPPMVILETSAGAVGALGISHHPALRGGVVEIFGLRDRRRMAVGFVDDRALRRIDDVERHAAWGADLHGLDR